MKALWVPVVVYLVATLGVPLLHPLDSRFADHLIIVLAGTAAVVGFAAFFGTRCRSTSPCSTASKMWQDDGEAEDR